MIKFHYMFLKRRIPTCYLLSSKFILTLAIVILFYFLSMDIILFNKVKNRGPFVPFSSNNNNIDKNSVDFQNFIKINSTLPSSYLFNSKELLQNGQNNEYKTETNSKTQQYSLFWPLPVKKIMMAPATHYIRSPMAEFVEHSFHFSDIFPFISANLISLTHCVLSVVSAKFLINDSLFWRQVGVCIFQFRNFLDSFDGVIYRAHAKRSTYKSHYGSIGYFVDAFSDVFGGICLIGAVAIYLFKHRPLNKNLTRCFRLADEPDDSSNTNDKYSTSSKSNNFNSSSSNSQFFPNLTKNNLNDSFSNGIMYSSNEEKYRDYNQSLATLSAVLISVGLLGLRLALSALFWDRSVHTYEDLLDSVPKSVLHQQLQTYMLKSSITICIMFAWRIMCALSLQDMILTALFIDKLWEFIVKTQYIGWILLICLIILTELHVSELRSILSQAI